MSLKSLFAFYALLGFSISYSQDFSKYDDSYGVFILQFEINKKGKAVFNEIEQIKCKDCSEEFIEKFKTETIKSFNKTKNKYESNYSKSTSNKKSLKFNLPIIFKIEDLLKEFEI